MLQPENCEGTILPLNTADGILLIPSIYSDNETKPLVLYDFTFHLMMEQISYSIAPYTSWRPMEARVICFPSEQTILHRFPSLQHHPPSLDTPGRERVTFQEPRTPASAIDHLADLEIGTIETNTQSD